MNAAQAVDVAAPDDWNAFVPGSVCKRDATGSGPLDGLRLAVKDLIDVDGCVTGGGNPDWARSRAPAADDAWAVQALRGHGACIVGKTITDEFAFSLEGENHFHGTPRNPRAPGRLPGGSSSGSAVAVAAGLADIGLGTDTGGSVRVPASFCGLYGMRPTHGRISLHGVMPFAPSYDTLGWFAADADTLARAGSVLLAGASPGGGQPRPVRPLRPSRLCIARDAMGLADPACAAALMACAKAMGAIEPVDAFDGPWRDWLEAYTVLQGAEIQASLGPWIASEKPRFGDNIAPRFAQLEFLEPRAIAHWNGWRRAQAKRLHSQLAGGTVWLLPSAPCTALHRTATALQRSAFYERALTLSSLAGHAGLPQISMPLAQVDGLPIGLSLLGAPGSDESLLALAKLHAVAA